MKFNCDYFKQQRAAKLDQMYNEFVANVTWHTWFAWFPVKVVEGDCRWLEPVQRRVNDFGLGYWYAFQRGRWSYEYKLVSADS